MFITSAQQLQIAILKDGDTTGLLFPTLVDSFLYISTDRLVTISGGARYFAQKKLKESVRMWGIRVVFSPENPFVIIDGTPYNLGLPVQLRKEGLMVPLVGFFEAFALATDSRMTFAADTIRLTGLSGDASLYLQAPEDTAVTAVSRQSPKPETPQTPQKKTSQRGIIVIDPGHGGKDPGAIGPSGIREKDIVLAISKYLKTELEDADFEIIMTRDTDVFIPLSDRSRIANQADADLFVSIHCNASHKKEPHGTQGFYLSAAKTDEARATALLENQPLLLEDAPIIDNLDELQYIMTDMMQSKYQRESSILAYIVEQDIGKSAGLEARGPQGAGFYVLYGAYMPAILIETAFVSNSEEEKFLTLPNNQEKIAESIASGIEQYWENIHSE